MLWIPGNAVSKNRLSLKADEFAVTLLGLCRMNHQHLSELNVNRWVDASLFTESDN